MKSFRRPSGFHACAVAQARANFVCSNTPDPSVILRSGVAGERIAHGLALACLREQRAADKACSGDAPKEPTPAKP